MDSISITFAYNEALCFAIEDLNIDCDELYNHMERFCYHFRAKSGIEHFDFVWRTLNQLQSQYFI